MTSSSRLVKTLAAVLGVSFLALATWCGGGRGLVYVALYMLALVPGLPIGWRLFGREHPAGWVGGAIVGYALTSVALWLPMRLGHPTASAFMAVWAAVTIVCWGLVWRRDGDACDGIRAHSAATCSRG